MFRNRILFHFDDDFAGGAPAGDVGGAEAGDGPPAPEPALLAGDGLEPSPTWAPTREEWDAAQEQIAQFREIVEQARQYEEHDPGQPQPELDLSAVDPFSDDFGERLSALLDAKLEQVVGQLDQRLQPITDTYSKQREQEAEARAKDILADIASAEGDYNQDLARHLAEALLPDLRQRYGAGPRAAEAALREAAKQVRALEQAAEKRGAEKYLNQMARVGQVPREPGVEGSAVVGVPDARDEVDLARRLTGAY